MAQNYFYQQNDPYYDTQFYDENGIPITPKKARKVAAAYSILFFAIAAIMLVVLFVILYSHSKLYKRCSAEVVGVVVENVKNGSSEDSAVFPVFKYQYNGRTYTQQSTYSAELAVGDYKMIHIDPDDPTVYYIEKNDSTAVAALLLLSGVFIALGISLMAVRYKSKKNEQA